jgi:ubiquinone/menaquinone biosynthesis C-methylase UbiE
MKPVRLIAVAVPLVLVALVLAARMRGANDKDRVVELLGLAPGMTVADVGAGDGEWALEFARSVGPTGRVLATEISASRLDDIRKAATRASLDNVVAVEATDRASGLPEGCCDAIFMRHVYHHLTQPEATLASLRRALKPEGQMIVVDFEARWWSTPEGVHENRGGHGMPLELLAKELTRAGFEVVRSIDGWSGTDYLVLVRRGR